MPVSCSRAVNVAAHAHSLEPLKTGAVYFQSLSSMLPALALMTHGSAGGRQSYPPPAPLAASQAPHTGPLEASGAADLSGSGAAGAAPAGARHPAPGMASGRGPAPGVGYDDDSYGDAGLRVLDLCAAPGGKTALLAELMANRGRLLAVDASLPRLQRLIFNLSRLVPENARSAQQPGMNSGAPPDLQDPQPHAPRRNMSYWRRGCVTAIHADGRRLALDADGWPSRDPSPAHGRGGSRTQGRDPWVHGVFDLVLVDAPCSGLGRLRLGRPASVKDWDPGLREVHAARQRALLRRGAGLLRRGGSLVYSTCTLDPGENEEVVSWLLQQVPGLQLVEPHLPVFAPLPSAPTGSLQLDGRSPSVHCDATLAPRVGPADDGTRSGSAGAATAGPCSVPLRTALEAHRPGCTYPPLLDALEAGGDAVGHRVGAGKRKAGARAGAMSAAEARDQMERCVRIAPGAEYEGFFLAQIIKT